MNVEDLNTCKLIIREQPSNHRQYSLPSVSQVAAVFLDGAESNVVNGRDIVVQTMSGQLMNVKDVAGYYDPLQYPLLLPHGSYGWDINSRNDDGSECTCRDFYAYMLQIREGDPSLILRGDRLLQQYIVDNYVKIEAHRLRWLQSNQSTIRSELYQGLHDSFQAGEVSAENVGRRTILPSSFGGSPRDMHQRYQDAMAIVQKYGKPDILLTMTCNTAWEEIANELLPGQTSQDRPDLLTRVFRAKYELLKKDIYKTGVLGKVIAHVHVIEFQKRGLPHCHMVIILDENDKLNTTDDYDHIVRAEIPFRDEEPELYNIVLKHMIHGPCGTLNENSPCMKNGSCKRNYPKQFSEFTVQGNDCYPIYRRRNDGRSVVLDRNTEVEIDNTWVVPYNPWLLLKYDCHINLEVCSSIKCVKYLYKYVYKGPDRVSLEVRLGPNYDEISKYLDARWICAPEALWKLFTFPMNRIYPSVERLQIHLPNRHQVRYYSHTPIREILEEPTNSMTMLTQFFQMNSISEFARLWLYREFPQHFRWLGSQRTWQRRVSTQKVIGRIYTVCPSEGERFYLRILLNHVRGPKSFDDLLTVNGIAFPTFKQVAERMGLLEDDGSIRQCLLEATTTRMPSALRRLFATILVYCEPVGVRILWEEFHLFMAQDYSTSASSSNHFVINLLLRDLNGLLQQHGKRITDYDLPQIDTQFADDTRIGRNIQDELSVHVPPEDLASIDTLNADQRNAFNIIMAAIRRNESASFFIDGPGGTGKTYLYRAILASLRSNGHIAIATATSGIAATILPGGRTAQSLFKIPIDLLSTNACSISKQSDLADLLRRAVVLIWDEATMTHRKAFEALDTTLRDITGVEMPFGGKVMILGGDFRQVLPVVPHGSKAQMIDACIVKSLLWNAIRILPLKHNMRAQQDPEFADFLLRVGDGNEPFVQDDMIRIPDALVIPWVGDESLGQLIASIFPGLEDNAFDSSYMVDRAIITPRNEDVDKLNEVVLNSFPGEDQIYYSFDRVEDDPHNLYQQEFLNSIAPGGLPSHKLTLKLGAPIMLLRNIDPKSGLCNGTRLICRGFFPNFIDAEILTGHFKGTRVFLPRIPLKPSENVKLPFSLIRRQFPIRLSFALTINKAQGQTIPNVGVYLPNHVFSHGQLYVALSRGVSIQTTKVLIKNSAIEGEPGAHTRNVVFKDVLTSCQRQ
ncbi:hypothetical protein ABKV19_022807 [Rosa sericea]